MICINTDSSSSGIGVYAKIMGKVVGENNIISIIMDKRKKNYEYPGKVVVGIFPPGTTGWQFNSRFYRTIFKIRKVDLPKFVHFLSPFLMPTERQEGIVTIHDLYHLYRTKKHEGYIAKLFEIYKKWENIIAISEVTKKDLLRIGAKEENVKVIHHSLDEYTWHRADDESIITTRQRIGVPENKKIVLTVGDGIGKNNELVRKAVKGDYFHIHVGSDIQADVNLSNIKDSELVSLYSMADVFCRPSSYEGFGRPPLESLFCGTPAVVSDIEIYKEILGSSGIYSKLDVASIKESIKIAINEGPNIIKGFDSKYRSYYSMPRFIDDMTAYYQSRGYKLRE
ncbi:MAG: glycosyltransferase [Thermoplasmatales archaeon]